MPVDDMAEIGQPLDEPASGPRRGGPVAHVDLAVDPPAAARADPRAPLDDRVRERPPARRAPRRAAQRARRRGPRARPPRVDRARAAARDRGRPEGGPAARDRRHEQPRARHRHGRGRPRRAGRVAGVGGERPAAHRPRRPPGRRAEPRQDLPEVPRRPARGERRGRAHARRARSRRRACRATRSTCSRSRSSRCARSTSGTSTTCSPRCGARPTSPSCPRDVFLAVLDLLAGRYPSDEFAELRPRLVWDRQADVVRARDGAGSLAITSGGTIPDRGLFGVFLPDGTRVGELDEEMVYETRRGEVFLLGASTWRIEEITRDRVVVTPAPGEPGKMPFWHGDKPGRPLELGRAIGAFTRELRGSRRDGGARPAARRRSASTRGRPTTSSPTSTSRARPPARCPTTARSWSSASATRSATGASACSRPSAPGCTRRGRSRSRRGSSERLGPGAQVLWSDDGIVIRLPEAVERIPVDDLLFEPDQVEEAVVEALPGTALFASVFREASARALLLPRQRPGQAHAAVAAAPAQRRPARGGREAPRRSRCCSRPRASACATCSTCRRCARCWATCASRTHEARGGRHRAGLAVRAVAAVRLDRRLHVRGRRAARRAPGRRARARPRPAARAARLRGAPRAARPARDRRARARAAAARRRASRARRRRRARPAARARAAHRRRGGRAHRRRRRGVRCSRCSTTGARCACASPARPRLAAVEDAARLRDALGVSLPRGLPGAFTDPAERPAARPRGAVRAHARSVLGRRRRRAPRGRRPTASSAALDRARGATARVTQGEFRPAASSTSGATPTCCAGCAGARSPRCAARSSPSRRPRSRRFLPAWQGADRPSGASDALVEAIAHLQGAAVPASVLETDVLPARVRGYRPADLDALAASGELVWIGAGALGADDGRVALCFRDQARALLAGRGAPGDERPDGAAPRRDPRAPRRARRVVLARPRARPPARPTSACCCTRCGIWSGRARSRTTPSRRCAPSSGAARPGCERRPGAPASAGRAAARRARPPGAGRWSLHRAAARARRHRPPRPRTPARCSCSIATAS